MRRWTPVLLLTLLVFTPLYSQETLVSLERIYPEYVERAGFELSRDQEIEVEAVGLYYRQRRYDFMLGTAWILDAKTREVVWELPASEGDPDRDRELQRFSGKILLPGGQYEVYYSSFPYYRWQDDDWSYSDRWDYGRKRGWRNWMSRLFDGDWDNHWRDEYPDAFREFKIVVRGQGKKLDYDAIEANHKALTDQAVISLLASRDERYLTQGFTVDRNIDIEVYAVGEANRDGNYDYGVILNTKTRERVWQLDYRNSEHAGGARKNRVVRETVSLSPGTYVAFYLTDDSHSPREWNSPPPYDPAFWGLTIRTKSPDQTNSIKKFDYEGYKLENAIIDFTRLRDDEFRSQGFTLKKPMKLRIYAIGEGRDGEMYDYGWIVDGKSHRRVWEMDYYDTEHAGGGQKNRLFDNVVDLEAGSYVAYFVTDGSHSYRDWNTSPPFDQENWGIAILPTDDNFNRADIADFQPAQAENVLASIVGVRDYDFERTRFKLEKDTELRIYAIGEGMGGRMYDYGWIEDAESGRVVWEMTYRMTDHAGGADKNRMYDNVITLSAGEYILFYETDDSHSFNDWNSSPPYDPVNWGITVYRVAE